MVVRLTTWRATQGNGHRVAYALALYFIALAFPVWPEDSKDAQN